MSDVQNSLRTFVEEQREKGREINLLGAEDLEQFDELTRNLHLELSPDVEIRSLRKMLKTLRPLISMLSPLNSDN